jgi:hypothetical protein
MGDYTTDTLQLLERQDEQYARELLEPSCLYWDEDSMKWILNHIDCFVSQSRGNCSVENVILYPNALNGHDDDDDIWDKVGQAIGNLQALNALNISNGSNEYEYDDDDEVVPNPGWGELDRILSHMRQTVDLVLNNADPWTVREEQALARAIRGHPTITRFDSGNSLPHEASDTMYSALATLPALEVVRLSSHFEIPVASHESLTELLRAPSLRSVYFEDLYFTPALCEAAAIALMEGTAITKLAFKNCSICAEGSAAVMANGLGRNTSVISIEVVSVMGEALIEVLAPALPLNSTLQELSFDLFSSIDDDYDDPNERLDWSPIFLALGKNTGLKTLRVDDDDFGLMEESLCTAMMDGLGMNETLESLEFLKAVLRDDNADLWCRALSFLRTNKALKSLAVDVHRGVTESCLSAFRIDIVTMLQENTSLESLSIKKHCQAFEIVFNDDADFGVDAYVALVTMLQQNTTLKRLELNYGMLKLTTDEDKHMAKSLQKNYALESLPSILLENRPGDVRTILRLNAAGRRYLIEDGSSVAKGVEVLSAVRGDINCVFLHLLENPRLCDRSAVEVVASDSTEESRGSANPANRNGKREQGRALEKGKESRRRQS